MSARRLLPSRYGGGRGRLRGCGSSAAAQEEDEDGVVGDVLGDGDNRDEGTDEEVKVLDGVAVSAATPAALLATAGHCGARWTVMMEKISSRSATRGAAGHGHAARGRGDSRRRAGVASASSWRRRPGRRRSLGGAPIGWSVATPRHVPRPRAAVAPGPPTSRWKPRSEN